jgi:hypothetical protein
MKVCVKCKVEKDDEFYPICAASKDGLNSWCKECKSIYNKEKRKNRNIVKEGIKICTFCKIEKDVSLFSLGNNDDGLNNWCKECNNIYSKDYYKENKERLKPIRKIWKENNLDKVKEYQKNRYISIDKDRLKLYYIENKDEVNNKKKEYRNTEEYKNWIKYYRISNSWKDRYRNSLRCVLNRLDKDKDAKTDVILGYSSLDFKKYIESKFNDSMSWYIRDSFHIDHIVPVSAFRENTPINIVNSLENLRPLSVKENLVKNNSIDYSRIDLYIKYINYLKPDFVDILNNI